MNFFLGIRTIALIHGNDGGLRRDSVEMRVERKLSRQEKRKFIRGKLARV